MIILIDIGNTRTKYSIVSDNKRTPMTAISNELFTNDFFNKQFNNAFKMIVASVNHNKLTDELSAWCKINKVTYQRVISEVKKNNVLTGYQQPKKLGVDRWLALVGAAELLPNKNILIIDAGTATTIDLLAANGQHQGGWILAGITTLITSVLAETAQVQANDNEKESIAFGLDTSANVHNAAWAATAGTINLAISQAQQQGIPLDEVILTGGNGTLLSTLISQQSRVIDDLVLRGLQAYI